MTCLDATFTLTPKSPDFNAAPNNEARLYCHGADFWPWTTDLSSDYAGDRFFFEDAFHSDPTVDYSKWANRQKARFLQTYINLAAFGANKQLALIFAFDNYYPGFDGRVLVYSDAGLVKDQKLAYGDSQFLLEIESLDDAFWLYFIHAGGHWFFKGLSGYVV